MTEKPIKYILKCLVCEQVFTCKHQNRKTCSLACRLKLYRMRKNPAHKLNLYKKIKQLTKEIQEIKNIYGK